MTDAIDYETTVADTYGDHAHVAGDPDIGRVYLNGGEEMHTDYSFTPKAARKLAKALKKAAKRAEAGR